MTTHIRNSKLEKPVEWTPQLLKEHTRDVERQERTRAKVILVAKVIFYALTVACVATACFASLELAGSALLIWMVAGSCLMKANRGSAVTLAERGWNIKLDQKFHSMNWKYYPNGPHGRLTIHCPHLLNEERKELIETCHAGNAVVEFEDFKLKRQFDLAKPADWLIIHSLVRKVLRTALHLIPTEAKKRTDFAILNDKLAMLTLKDDKPFRQPVILVDRDTVIIDYIKGIDHQDFKEDYTRFKTIFDNGMTDIYVYPQYKQKMADGTIKEVAVRNYPQWGEIDEKNVLVKEYKATHTTLAKC